MSTSEPRRSVVARPASSRSKIDPLALAQHAEHRALERVVGQVVLGQVGVAHDDAVAGVRVVRLDHALHVGTVVERAAQPALTTLPRLDAAGADVDAASACRRRWRGPAGCSGSSGAWCGGGSGSRTCRTRGLATHLTNRCHDVLLRGRRRDCRGSSPRTARRGYRAARRTDSVHATNGTVVRRRWPDRRHRRRRAWPQSLGGRTATHVPTCPPSNGSTRRCPARRRSRPSATPLRAHREAINRLNVYPVPDGDTGTNMALTARVGGRRAGATAERRPGRRPARPSATAR